MSSFRLVAQLCLASFSRLERGGGGEVTEPLRGVGEGGGGGWLGGHIDRLLLPVQVQTLEYYLELSHAVAAAGNEEAITVSQ